MEQKKLKLLAVLAWSWMAAYSAPTVLKAQIERGPEYYSQVVQTLIDTEAGVKSKGASNLTPAQVQNHLMLDPGNFKVFSVPLRPQHSLKQGELRITVGANELADLSSTVWRRLKGDQSNQASVWSRIVNLGGEKQLEVAMRRHILDLIFEVRSVFSSGNIDRQTLSRTFALLVANADGRGLFQKEAPQTPPSAETEPEPRPAVAAAASEFIGTWIGPMENSRGELQEKSVLIFNPGLNGTLQGVWHAGWKFSGVKPNGRKAAWKLSNVLKKCRDYDNIFELKPDGKGAVLTYTVTDRCRTPNEYTGKATLEKQP